MWSPRPLMLARCRGDANLGGVIPLPRAWLFTAALLVGAAVGMVAAIGAAVLISAQIRPDVVIGLVVGVPSLAGLALIIFSTRRWMTTLGVFLVAVAPGWFGVLVATQVAYGA